MKRAPLRHRLEYVGYRAAKGVFGMLSRPIVRRLGHRVGRLAVPLFRTHRKLALRNLELALPELRAEERGRVVRSCFGHFGAAFVEMALAEQLDTEDLETLFDIEGWEHVEAARSRDRGFFLLGSHLGSFEMAAYPLAHRLGDLHFVARALDNPFVDRDMRRVRERFGTRLLGKKGAGHRMLNVIRHRGCVGVIIDQRVRPAQGILVPFLGQPAWTSPVLAYLSLHSGAPVVPVFCFPANGGRYQLRCDPAILPDGFDKGAEGEAALTRRYLEVIEEEIRRRPELWLWMHRRWR